MVAGAPGVPGQLPRGLLVRSHHFPGAVHLRSTQLIGVRVERPASYLVEFLMTDYRLTDHVFFGVQAAAVQMHLEFLEGNHLRLTDRRN